MSLGVTIQTSVRCSRKAWRKFLLGLWPEGTRALIRKRRVARSRWLGMHSRWCWEAQTGRSARDVDGFRYRCEPTP